VAICCAWNKALADGELTYSIAGGDAAVQDVLRSAVRGWDDALPGLTLREVPSRADIRVTFGGDTGAPSEGTGGAQGLATTTLNARHFIVRVEIAMQGDLAPGNREGLEQVTMHEVGHALGLGHADFNGDLMSPTVPPSSAPVPACDAAAVTEANRWKLIEDAPRPHAPAADWFAC
jgi:predicted Zn-dependent protease